MRKRIENKVVIENRAVTDLQNRIHKRIFPLFVKADKKKLKKAVVSRNLLAVSKALRISKKELQAILGEGQQQVAFKVFRNFLGVINLIERMKKFLRNHTVR